jgi:hypothetical protein
MVPALKSFFQKIRISEKMVKPVSISILSVMIPIIITNIFIHFRYVKLVLDGLVVAPFTFPEKGSELLQKINLEGNVFNADRYGGYLIWKNFPENKVYIDTRLSMRPAAYFSNYLDLLKNPEKFNVFSKKNNITSVILPIANIDCYIKIAGYLYNDKLWKLIYTDGSEILFVKETSTSLPGLSLDLKTKETISNEILSRYKFPAIQNEGLYNLERLYSLL